MKVGWKRNSRSSQLVDSRSLRFARRRISERKVSLQRDDDDGYDVDKLNKLRGLISFDVARSTYPSLDAMEPYNSFSFAGYVSYV